MTLREATIASIEIEGREVDIDVVAPTKPEMTPLLMRLPDAALEAEHENDLTMYERAETAHALVNATTDLPRDLIEQLPISAVEELAGAAELVINQQVRVWRRRHARNDPAIDHTTVEYEFIAEDSESEE